MKTRRGAAVLQPALTTSLRLLTAATAIPLSVALTLAATPAQRCAADKNKAAGKYFACRQRAEAKAIGNGAAPDFARCDAILAHQWEKLEARADGACADSVSDADLIAFATKQSDAVAAALRGESALPAPDYSAFASPQTLAIVGYAADAMEPALSRDGSTLFFNDDGPNKDLYYATRTDATTFRFAAAIKALNTAEVDAVPSIDDDGNFYFVTTAHYSPPTAYDTLFRGRWSGSTVTDVTPLSGLARTIPGLVNFDLVISADGGTLYFVDGDFRAGGDIPGAADIAVALAIPGGFARHPDSATLLARVNTAALEYAPEVSADGLELFFTRLDPATLETSIYRTTRTASDHSFATPQRVAAINGFVEAPALSADGKSLYYHKRNPAGVFEIQRVTRP